MLRYVVSGFGRAFDGAQGGPDGSSKRPDASNLVNPFGAGVAQRVGDGARPDGGAGCPGGTAGAHPILDRVDQPETDVAAEARRIGPDEPPRDATRRSAS